MLTSPGRLGSSIALGSLFGILAALSTGACGGVVIEGSGGGGGTSSTTTSDDACTPAGGTCIALVPDSCMNGTWLDADQYPCGSGDGVGCCLVPVCTPGQDQSCNAIASMSSFAGKCEDNGTCTCLAGFTKNAEGKCG